MSDLELFSKIWSHLHIVLKCANAFYIMQKWYVDGTVECYVKEHLPWQALPF